MPTSARARLRALWPVVLLFACTEDPTRSPGPAGAPMVPAAAVSAATQVIVPPSMTSAPFNVPRTLTVPSGFQIAVYARISGARFMAITPDGNLLVSRPGAGTISLVRPNGSGDPLVSSFATGLQRPHDLVFTTSGGTTYLYVSEKNKVGRYTWVTGNLTGQNRQVIVSNLPDASLPELNGSYGHELKNIAISSAGKLYVSIASTCNACTSDGQANPVRASIYEYNLDGTGGRLFARGLRNAEGLAFVPGTTTLWVVVNNRDNIAFPNHADFNGDGSDDYGKVMQAYVDNHPPDEFTRVRLGGNYGWPFCNPNPDTPNGLANMPFDRDVQHNGSGAVNCGAMDVINRGIQAHSAPLGLLFLQNTQFPSPYRASAVAALHGSWNRSSNVGYKVVYFPWDAATQTPTGEADLVSGWATASSSWGRPVDIAVDAQGAMFISDDKAGAVYKLTQQSTQPPPGGTQYEFEQATVKDGMTFAKSASGFTGTGYLRFRNATGSFVQLTINVATAGTKTLTFRYAHRAGQRPLEIRVNGAVVNPGFAFAATGSTSTWRTVSLTVNLNAGNNTVRATSIGFGGPNLDNLVVN